MPVRAAARYEEDVYSWSREQAEALRRVAASRVNLPEPVDFLNIAEEIESLGISQLNELYSRYRVLLMHLLKWQFQPEKRSPSCNEIRSRLQRLLEHLLKLAYAPMVEPRHGWRRTVREQRDAIERVLDESPSPRRLPGETLGKAYAKARRDVLAEYRLPEIPPTRPFDLEREVLAEEWFPSET